MQIPLLEPGVAQNYSVWGYRKGFRRSGLAYFTSFLLTYPFRKVHITSIARTISTHELARVVSSQIKNVHIPFRNSPSGVLVVTAAPPLPPRFWLKTAHAQFEEWHKRMVLSLALFKFLSCHFRKYIFESFLGSQAHCWQWVSSATLARKKIDFTWKNMLPTTVFTLEMLWVLPYKFQYCKLTLDLRNPNVTFCFNLSLRYMVLLEIYSKNTFLGCVVGSADLSQSSLLIYLQYI